MPAVLLLSTTLVSSTVPDGVTSTSVLPPAEFATIRLPFGSSAIATGALRGFPLRTTVPHVVLGYLQLNDVPPGLTTISPLTSSSLALLKESTTLSTPSTA